MTRLTKALLGMMFSFLFTFTCVGYAELTDSLTITGTAEATPPEGIYITEMEMVTATTTSQSASHIEQTTTVNSTINGTRYESVTYKITVWNNTPYKYAYTGINYVSSYEDNQYIGNGITITTKDNSTDSSATFNTADTVDPGETITFYATYTISRRTLNNQDLTTSINYQFGVNIDSVGDVAMDAVLQRFGEILNDTSDGGSYETLIDKIDDKFDGTDWKANFIGNVVDANNADTVTINSLFEGKLTLTIDDVETNITLLIKREDVDNNTETGDDYTATSGNSTTTGTGCEMTLYMTTDPLQSGRPTVYAAVFTCNKNDDGTYGSWYMIGDVYEGTAEIVGYTGISGGTTTGSFNTGDWRAEGATYQVTDDYSYTVAANSTIQTITQAVDQNATNKLQTLLTRANDILNGVYGSYGGQAILDLETAFNAAARGYTVNSDGSVTVNSGITRSQAIPLIKELEQALIPFESIATN